jgi:chloride channel 2
MLTCKNDATYLEMLSAACACGVTLAFGSPIGGVLFSIEVTTSFYLISNLWRGLFVSACAALLLTAVDESGMYPTEQF